MKAKEKKKKTVKRQRGETRRRGGGGRRKTEREREEGRKKERESTPARAKYTLLYVYTSVSISCCDHESSPTYTLFTWSRLILALFSVALVTLN